MNVKVTTDWQIIIPVLVTALFFVLKLANIIDWDWVWVFAPLWIPLIIIAVFIIFAWIAVVIAGGHMDM
jgi:hypothetical protein